MANGTTDEKLARADRIAEQSAKAQKAAEQHSKATRNAIANMRERPLKPYRDEQDSETELSVNRQGIHLKAPLGDTAKNALVIGLVLALVIATAGWVAVQVMRAG